MLTDLFIGTMDLISPFQALSLAYCYSLAGTLKYFAHSCCQGEVNERHFLKKREKQ